MMWYEVQYVAVLQRVISGRMYRYAVVANFARRIVRNVFMAVE